MVPLLAPLWLPFGSLLVPFGLCLAPFGSSLAPFWLQLGSLWLPLGPLWHKTLPLHNCFDTFPLHMAPFGPKALHCITFLTLSFHIALPPSLLRHSPTQHFTTHSTRLKGGGISKQSPLQGALNPTPPQASTPGALFRHFRVTSSHFASHRLTSPLFATLRHTFASLLHTFASLRSSRLLNF